MSRSSKIPPDVLREVVGKLVEGELTNVSAVEYLKAKGYPEVSPMAIQRARNKFKAMVITERRIKTASMPAMEELPEMVVRELGRLEEIIQAHHMYIDDLKKQLAPFCDMDDAKKRYNDNLLRSEIRKNLESEVKAICEKTRLMIERRTIIQSVRFGDMGTSEDAYAKGYREGMIDAKDEFLRLCRECKGSASQVVEAKFREIGKEEACPPPEATPETPQS
jgi:hypothetical protein